MSSVSTTASRGLLSGFADSAARWPQRPAVEVDGSVVSYGELEAWSASIAATLDHADPTPGMPLTAVWAARTRTAFAGVVAALCRGHGYLPLNPAFPPERTRAMLARSGCRAIIADRHGAEQLEGALGREG